MLEYKVIASAHEVRGVMSHVGRPDDGTDVTSFFNIEFNAPLQPMETWRTRPLEIYGCEIPFWHRAMTREELQDELSKRVAEVPGIHWHFQQLIGDNVREAPRGGEGTR